MLNTRARQLIYIFLAFAGLIGTWYFNLQFFLTSEDTSITAFLNQTGDSYPALSINVDIAIASITFLLWMLFEGIRLKMKNLWVYVILTFLVAFAFSFPLFLYFRERKLASFNQD